jgi:opacity protein-like surface antigen
MSSVRILLAAGIAAALAGTGTSALAQDAPGLYVTGDGGASFLPNLRLKDTPAGTQHENFNTGYAMGGAVGYDTGDGARVEIDSNYTLNGLNKLNGVPANGHLDSTSVMVNGQLDLLHHSQLTPYAGVGIGYENIGVGTGGASDHDWKPAYQAEAGLRDDISDRVSVFGEYRFTQSEAAELSDGHQHFADHGLLAGLTFRPGN